MKSQAEQIHDVIMCGIETGNDLVIDDRVKRRVSYVILEGLKSVVTDEWIVAQSKRIEVGKVMYGRT